MTKRCSCGNGFRTLKEMLEERDNMNERSKPEIGDEVFAEAFERRFGISLEQFALALGKHSELSGIAFQELEQVSNQLVEYNSDSRCVEDEGLLE